jgi:hypothetical protein
MGLNFIGVPQQQAPFAGISITDSLCTFVALRKWGTDGLHVVDLKFYTAEDGSGLATCPFKKEFQKHMVPYDGDFNWSLALRYFLEANRVVRMGYSPEDVTISSDTVEMVPVAAEQIGPALTLLRATSPLKDTKEPTKILSHFIKAVPTDGDLSKSQDRIEPVLAVLYAIIASGEVEAHAQRARDLALIQQSRNATFNIIMRNGLRISTSKDGAQVSIRNGDAVLAPDGVV